MANSPAISADSRPSACRETISIGENWLAAQPTANMARATRIQAAGALSLIIPDRIPRIVKRPFDCPWRRLAVMEAEADLAAMGRLIGDPNRALMLTVLLGGTPQSGSALAAAAGISRSLASAHLKKLTAGGLVRAERHGRQRLYSI